MTETRSEIGFADINGTRTLDPPAVGRLHEIVAPMLVITGELDQPSALEQAAFITEHVPQAETVTLPTAHLPNMERPDEFNEIVRTFLQRHA